MGRHTESKCSVPNCDNAYHKKKKPDAKFFKFPVYDPIRCRAWLKAVGCEELLDIALCTLDQNRRVCSEHFQPDEYVQGRVRCKLRKTSIPTLNLTVPPLTDDLINTWPNCVENAEKVPCVAMEVEAPCPKQPTPSSTPSMPRAQPLAEITGNQLASPGPSGSSQRPPAQSEVLLQTPVGVSVKLPAMEDSTDEEWEVMDITVTLRSKTDSSRMRAVKVSPHSRYKLIVAGSQ